MRLYLLLLFLGCCSLADAQSFDKKLNFENGIYLQFQEYKNNKPSVAYKKLTNFEYALNAEENILILTDSASREFVTRFGEAIWGLCINHQPYIQIESRENGVLQFARLHVIGKISYYHYETFLNKPVTMYVHNPYTGERIGEKQIVNKEEVRVQRILHFDSGEVIDFTHQNLLAWTADDKGLQASIKELKADELEEKLFKCLLIYNDRNVVYLQP